VHVMGAHDAFRSDRELVEDAMKLLASLMIRGTYEGGRYKPYQPPPDVQGLDLVAFCEPYCALGMRNRTSMCLTRCSVVQFLRFLRG
jgi:hypothetical protein